MTTKVSPKEETRRSTANWEKEIEHYLFDTNLRWSFLHTKIINRMLIGDGDAEEYVNTIEKTKALLSAQQKKTEKLVLERMIEILDEKFTDNGYVGWSDGDISIPYPLEVIKKELLSEMEEKK